MEKFSKINMNSRGVQGNKKELVRIPRMAYSCFASLPGITDSCLFVDHLIISGVGRQSVIIQEAVLTPVQSFAHKGLGPSVEQAYFP
jgi:hypothetical protein